MKKSFFVIVLALFLVGSMGYSQTHIYTQSHQSPVSMTAFAKDGSFFSVGQDGFIIKWTSDGLGEHYQITELEIRLISISPNGNDIAVYETDGYSIHRVSVWNWTTLKRKFVKSFTSSITELKYTAKGTLLAVGTATVDGAIYFNANSGQKIAKVKDATGIVNMIYSSSSEKSAVMYSPAGHLTYYNMTTGKRKQRFQTEQQLEQVSLFNNNLFLAGTKNNQIYIIDALSGKTAGCIAAESPVIFSDPQDTSIYYMENNGRNSTLKMINASLNTDGSTTVNSPITIKSLSGFSAKNNITAVSKTDTSLIIGTKTGDIYKTDTTASGSTVTLIPITDNMYDKVLDIITINNEFYCLTPKTIFNTSYDTGVVNNICNNNDFTDMLPYGNNIILWSKGERKNVSLFNIETKETTSLFMPKSGIQVLKLFGDKLVYIEGNTTVQMYDIISKTTKELYVGTGLQDVILYKDEQLIVAKSAASNPRSPLINVNIDTKETVMLPLNGNVAFSLCYNENSTSSIIYGLLMTTSSNGSQTSIFAYYPEKKTSSIIMRLDEEDTNAFLIQYGINLYTNLGKSQIKTYNTNSKRQTQLVRSASLPLKVARTANRLAVLNRDGSVSWYDSSTGKYNADWYMTTDGIWFEF